MKVNALVVAAMVITSVNAVGMKDSQNTPQESKTVRKDRICSTIISELHSLQEKVDALYSVLWNQIPDSYNLENRASGLEALDVQGWLKSYYKDNPELLLPIKEKFADLEKQYRSVWTELEIEVCSIEYYPYLKSPEELVERRYFPRWQN
ncbi:hypothetical protein BASA60_001857 [Batrachochytrium salamandrivorans]|nr:hypothetical protein BASA60_001857 [Batrachochytrium salamandrivorans]